MCLRRSIPVPTLHANLPFTDIHGSHAQISSSVSMTSDNLLTVTVTTSQAQEKKRTYSGIKSSRMIRICLYISLSHTHFPISPFRLLLPRSSFSPNLLRLHLSLSSSSSSLSSRSKSKLQYERKWYSKAGRSPSSPFSPSALPTKRPPTHKVQISECKKNI